MSLGEQICRAQNKRFAPKSNKKDRVFGEAGEMGEREMGECNAMAGVNESASGVGEANLWALATNADDGIAVRSVGLSGARGSSSSGSV